MRSLTTFVTVVVLALVVSACSSGLSDEETLALISAVVDERVQEISALRAEVKQLREALSASSAGGDDQQELLNIPSQLESLRNEVRCEVGGGRPGCRSSLHGRSGGTADDRLDKLEQFDLSDMERCLSALESELTGHTHGFSSFDFAHDHGTYSFTTGTTTWFGPILAQTDSPSVFSIFGC